MKTAHFLRKPLTTSQDLSAAALDYTTVIPRPFKLEMVTIKASINISETITISIDSASGANYDTVIAKRTLVAEQDFLYKPEGECNFLAGDQLKVECTDANGLGTAYLEIRTSEM